MPDTSQELFPQRLSQIFDRYPYLQDIGRVYSFILDNLGDDLGLTYHNQGIPPKSTDKNLELPKREFDVRVNKDLYSRDPVKAANILGHEYSHVAAQASPSWSQIFQAQQPNPALRAAYSQSSYPKEQMLEEFFARNMSPAGQIDRDLIKYVGQLSTPDQKALLGHFTRYLMGGPDALWSGLVDPATKERDTEPGKAFRYQYQRAVNEK